VGLDGVLNNPSRHSREDGNPGGGYQGSIEPLRSLCPVFWIPPYQVRGKLYQVRNDRIQSLRYPTRLRRGSSFKKNVLSGWENQGIPREHQHRKSCPIVEKKASIVNVFAGE